MVIGKGAKGRSSEYPRTPIRKVIIFSYILI